MAVRSSCVRALLAVFAAACALAFLTLRVGHHAASRASKPSWESEPEVTMHTDTAVPQLSASGNIILESFSSGQPMHQWHAEDDPVMGGESESNFTQQADHGDYAGSCRIVPKLQAPGFTIVMTEHPLLGRFPDVSSKDGLLLRLKNVGGNITSFKAAFCDSRIYWTCQFASYKANFNLTQDPADTEVFLPWQAFSNKWDSATGEHTEESPPTERSLRSITQLQLWTEGVAGDFHIQIHSVEAAEDPASAWFADALETFI